MIRYAILFILVFSINAFADEVKKADTEIGNIESIVHEHDLSQHMGWSDQEAVFKAPRNFRSKHLNEIHMESEDTVEPLTN